jgi:hypothetical protein
MAKKKIHPDCPFTREEIDEIHSMLYQTNAGNICLNPGCPSWYSGPENSRQNVLKEIDELI